MDISENSLYPHQTARLGLINAKYIERNILDQMEFVSSFVRNRMLSMHVKLKTGNGITRSRRSKVIYIYIYKYIYIYIFTCIYVYIYVINFADLFCVESYSSISFKLSLPFYNNNSDTKNECDISIDKPPNYDMFSWRGCTAVNQLSSVYWINTLHTIEESLLNNMTNTKMLKIWRHKINRTASIS